MRVFIVEDEPIVLLGFERMVSATGHEVVGTAGNGEDAVEAILRLRPDVILMDVNLPGMDGITALKKVQQHVEIPTVLITGYRDLEVMERSRTPGVFGYLQKPVDEYEIRSMLQIAVDRHKELKVTKKERDQAIHRLDERKQIERAKAMLMDEFGLSDSEAMRSMQKKSKDQNQKLVEVARELLRKSEQIK